ncbi:hypothetical protein ZWY2020_018782 [Hordeum vulgare]|nr:hypothetical protein ZWY2020_018782 [Hordeum vulgare]
MRAAVGPPTATESHKKRQNPACPHQSKSIASSRRPLSPTLLRSAPSSTGSPISRRGRAPSPLPPGAGKPVPARRSAPPSSAVPARRRGRRRPTRPPARPGSG